MQVQDGPDDIDPDALDAFIERWRPAQAAELANAQPFLIELAALLGVPAPEPATKDPATDGYVFERAIVGHSHPRTRWISSFTT